MSMSVFAIQNFKIRGKTLPTYWNRTFLLLACQTQELTEKLKKLRMLFDNGLISQEEYNNKKLDLLSDL